MQNKQCKQSNIPAIFPNFVESDVEFLVHQSCLDVEISLHCFSSKNFA